jgi:hypothetical protein
MQRYQVYLEPKSVAVFDQTAQMTGVTRSKIIQQMVDIMALRFSAQLDIKDVASKKNILSFAGIIKYPKSKKNDWSTRPDNLYFGV